MEKGNSKQNSNSWNCSNCMEWSSGRYAKWIANGSSFVRLHNGIGHSTPLSLRPRPTTSPNLTPIYSWREMQKRAMNMCHELAVNDLTKLMSQLKLD